MVSARREIQPLKASNMVGLAFIDPSVPYINLSRGMGFWIDPGQAQVFHGSSRLSGGSDSEKSLSDRCIDNTLPNAESQPTNES
jgi:hypothetical protein